MAVPKKRNSKSKKNSRKANWLKKANVQSKRAYALAQSVIGGNSTSFIYNVNDVEKDEDEVN
jgi:large subunit ribosomal protein L32|tara:strand:+ start:3208 stop:3393 length:186 start_codon:yes stop_codon:yes gene_type:complete